MDEIQDDSKLKEILSKYKLQITFILVGIVLITGGIFLIKNNFFSQPKVEVLGESTTKETDNNLKEIVVEIAGQVEKPGVYKLTNNSRIDDLLVASGGLSKNADRVWIDKNLNRAAKLIDGQKLYIPAIGEQSKTSSAGATGGGYSVAQLSNGTYSNMVNINTASLSELDSLPGIGPKYGQNIIDNRPYSNINEVVSKGAIPQSTFNKIKDKITI